MKGLQEFRDTKRSRFLRRDLQRIQVAEIPNSPGSSATGCPGGGKAELPRPEESGRSAHGGAQPTRSKAPLASPRCLEHRAKAILDGNQKKKKNTKIKISGAHNKRALTSQACLEDPDPLDI